MFYGTVALASGSLGGAKAPLPLPILDQIFTLKDTKA